MNQNEIDALVKQTLDKYGLSQYYSGYKAAQAKSSSSSSRSSSSSSSRSSSSKSGSSTSVIKTNTGYAFSDSPGVSMPASFVRDYLTEQQKQSLSTPQNNLITLSEIANSPVENKNDTINKLSELMNYNPNVDLISATDLNEYKDYISFDKSAFEYKNDPFVNFDLEGFTANYNNLLAQEKKLQNEAMQLQKELANQELERQKLYDQYQIDEKTNQLNSLVNQLNTLKTSAQAKKLLVEGRLAPMHAITGEQAAIDRSTAVQALTIGAQIDALKSEITASLDKVDKAIQIKYEGIRQQIKLKEYQLDILERQIDRMDAERRKVLSALIEEKKAQLKIQEQKIKQEAQEEKDRQLMILNAMVNGAPQWLIAKLNQAKSLDEVIQLGGKYVVNPKDLAYIRNSYKSSSSRVRPLSPNELAKLYEIGYTANPGDTIYDARKIDEPPITQPKDNNQSWFDKILSWFGIGSKANEIEELRNY